MSQEPSDGLDIEEFASAADLESWLEAHHGTSPGIWVRLYRGGSGHTPVGFGVLLELGLCFGWSESMRRAYDAESSLQRFTPLERAAPRQSATDGSWRASKPRAG